MTARGENSGETSADICPGCGYAVPTADGYCLDCAPPHDDWDDDMSAASYADEASEPCPHCGEFECTEDTHG